VLVRLFSAADHHAFIAADLEEEFADIVTAAGVVAARRWYWKQTVFRCCRSATSPVRDDLIIDGARGAEEKRRCSRASRRICVTGGV
jgi:hypothetical protein